MWDRAIQGFRETFHRDPERRFSAPGRVELIGNHLDHQRGCVAAAALDQDILAAVAPNDEGCIRVCSEDYPPSQVALTELSPRPGEQNRSVALVRGVAAGFRALGWDLAGFDAYLVSRVPEGGGMASSAAFEVLLGTILNHLFCGGAVSPAEIARIGQWAENRYFGKPCGRMDQLACAEGGSVFIDFSDLDAPAVERLTLPFDGFRLCIVDAFAGHADLTEAYAQIPREMQAVAAFFEREVLSQVREEQFYANFSALRQALGDRAVLRAKHYFDEVDRVRAFRRAALDGDRAACLALLNASGRSSWMLLQNAIPAGSVREQPLAAALAVCEHFAGPDAAVRLHGGGFGGTVLVLLPEERAASFAERVDGCLGPGACRIARIVPEGCREVPAV